ncbi:MAG TPA: hypothetical protein DCE42_09415 [Myxococcales bacterium]|nr:hypothetical protein [Deltaproteobacteria bacterium]MBU49028.1 hypothetical protein [Deltaproteobacteria bacterium]HAA54964.1 hypothetical protein [Myxococcales bacterium]|tara:strand:- start:7389 stop:7946 length:558 start_codon:yes stop_codon:yes gene_type:complete
MKKSKRRGMDLVRSEVLKRDTPVPASKRHAPDTPAKGELARIQTKKVMRSKDGRVISLTPDRMAVWLVQLEPVNQIVLEGQLDEEGYDVEAFGLLQDLPQALREAERPPKLVIVQGQAVGQQTPFFCKQVLPLLQQHEIECVLNGLREGQEELYRTWYKGHFTRGQELEDVVRCVKKVIGPGLKR